MLDYVVFLYDCRGLPRSEILMVLATESDYKYEKYLMSKFFVFNLDNITSLNQYSNQFIIFL